MGRAGAGDVSVRASGEWEWIVDSGDLIAGRYRLVERLGSGGMSVVWRADDNVLGREVAIKVLSAALAGQPELQRQIRAEARAAARLRHANVVAVYDYGELTDAGRLQSYVVMELVDGRSLADLLTGGSIPWQLAVLVGAQVAAALTAAHADGIVHRDVKPANVMVTGTGVKLVDFGISAAVGALDDHDGQLLGTPAYLAPERIEGGPVRPATDVYALGLVLYLALAGRMPWPASTVTQMLKAHVYKRPAPLPPVPGLPPRIAQLVSRCLAKQPADRPSSIEVAELLGEVAGLPSFALMRSAAAPTLALPRTVVRRPRRRQLTAAAGVVAGLLTVGGAWWAYAESPDGVAAAGPPTTCATAGGAPASPALADGVCGPTATPAATPTSTSPPTRTTTPAPAATFRTVRVGHRQSKAKPGPAAAPKAKPAPKAGPEPAGKPKPQGPPKPKGPAK